MKTGFIGAGNMGGALARAAGKTGSVILVCDRDENRAAVCVGDIVSSGGIASAVTADRLIAESDIVFIGVKPQVIAELGTQIKASLEHRAAKGGLLLVSMAAGVSLSDIESALGSLPTVRIMPNTPVSAGEGMIFWCSNSAVSDDMKTRFLTTLSAAGDNAEVDERYIDAAGALSGCGPAFVYMFIDALADGGVAAGLPRDVARRAAVQTVIGAGELAKQTGKHPDELKDAVCSPGGTTIEGVRVLEERGFRAAAMDAVLAAYEKTSRLKGGSGKTSK